MFQDLEGRNKKKFSLRNKSISLRDQKNQQPYISSLFCHCNYIATPVSSLLLQPIRFKNYFITMQLHRF